MVEIKYARCTSLGAWRHLKRRFLIEQTRSRDDSSYCATWRNQGAPSLIKRMRLNGIDLHSSVSSKPLIEDKEPNLTAIPNFAYTLICSLTI